jgi:hypothetical protein
MDKTVISSALGFNFDVEITDQNGEVVPSGYKTILPTSDEEPFIGNRIGGETWFTTFNKDLLAKIRDYKRINL